MDSVLPGPARLTAGIVALVAWVGLAVQFDASMALVGSASGALGAMLLYFTVIANLLVAIVLTGVALGRAGFGTPVLLGGVTLAILLVGIVYALLLRGLLELSGGAKLADFLLHTVVPILVPLWWLAFSPKGGLRRRDPLLWALLPLAYFLYALARAAIDDTYAYPFMNVARLGWGQTLINAGAMAIGFLVTGFALVWLDGRIATRGRR